MELVVQLGRALGLAQRVGLRGDAAHHLHRARELATTQIETLEQGHVQLALCDQPFSGLHIPGVGRQNFLLLRLHRPGYGLQGLVASLLRGDRQSLRRLARPDR